MITVVIPTYNEENTIKGLLDSLLPSGSSSPGARKSELIVVDGGSRDRTVELARKYPVRLIETIANRAVQLNEGARVAQGDKLLFLPADCLIEERSLQAVEGCLANGYVGGCLTQRINSRKSIYRSIEASGNIRARLFKIFFGDQAIFVRRDVFFRLGGFDNASLFDDVIFSRKLRKSGPVCVLPQKVYASARRWQKQGVVKTSLINWIVSLGFHLGISPAVLKKMYYDIR